MRIMKILQRAKECWKLDKQLRPEKNLYRQLDYTPSEDKADIQ